MHWFPPACGGVRGGDRREPFCEDIYNCRIIGYRLSAIGYRLSAMFTLALPHMSAHTGDQCDGR